MSLFSLVKSSWIIIFLLLIYFLSRLLIVLHFPLFFDEAIYIHWGQFVKADFFWKWVSLIDGKQPLFIWITSFFQYLIKDPILAGRIVSLISGAFSLIGIYLISLHLSNKRTAVLSAVIYLLIPFYLIYDSLALFDSLLMALSVFAVLFSIRLAKSMNVIDAIFLGVIMGLGLLTKSSAQFFFLYPILAAFLFKKREPKEILKYFSFVILSFAIAKAMEAIMLFSPYYAVVAQKNSEFSSSFSEVLKAPLKALTNLRTIIDWLISYLSLPLLITSILSGVFIKKRVYFAFLLMAVIPLFTTALIGKQLYPRHLLFMTWPFIILAAYLITTLWDKYLKYKIIFLVLLVLISSIPFSKSFLFLVNPTKTDLPKIERWQFFEGEPSGIGLEGLVREIKRFENDRLLVLTDKPIGILPDGIAIYFFGKENIKIDGVDQINRQTLLRHILDFHPETVLLVTSWQDFPIEIESTEILKIERIGKQNKNWKLFRTEKISPQDYQ